MKAFAAALLLLVVAQDAPVRVPEYPPASEVRASFRAMLDRPRVAPDPKPLSSGSNGLPAGMTEETLTIATEKKPDGGEERVPVLIVRPKPTGKRMPVVIALHGTGGTKEGMKSWLIELARRGIIGVSIDGRYHGARAGNTGEGTKAYNEAIARAWRSKPGEPMEHPFYLDTCWDVWRTIDFLSTLDDVDAKRIGLFGISKGGIETWLAGSVDERVAVAVPAIGVQSLRWSLDNDRWQARANTIAAAHKEAADDRGERKVTRETCRALWGKIIPGLLDRYDCPSMLRLFAGRPLLIVNGEDDANCPLPGARIAFASAEAAFKSAGATEKLKIDVAEDSGHTITDSQKAMIFAWFEKWL